MHITFKTINRNAKNHLVFKRGNNQREAFQVKTSELVTRMKNLLVGMKYRGLITDVKILKKYPGKLKTIQKIFDLQQ